MEYLMCVVGGAFVPVIYGWYRDYEIEQLESKIKYQETQQDKEIQSFYDELISRGYGKFDYEHKGKPNKAVCTVERSFAWLDGSAVIENILKKRKEESK